MVFFLDLGLVGEAFHLTNFLILGPDLAGSAYSGVGSTETGTGCVGSNTTEVSRCSFKWEETEGMKANILSGRRLTGPKDDWSRILYTLTVLKEIHTSGGMTLTRSGSESSLKIC